LHKGTDHGCGSVRRVGGRLIKTKPSPLSAYRVESAIENESSTPVSIFNFASSRRRRVRGWSSGDFAWRLCLLLLLVTFESSFESSYRSSFKLLLLPGYLMQQLRITRTLKLISLLVDYSLVHS
jgi:hypothetical protein